MNVIVSTIVVTSVVVLLVYALLMRIGRGINAHSLQGEVNQQCRDENRQRVDEAPLLSTDGHACRMQQPEADSKSEEKVTLSPTNLVDRSHCPACGAIITANDERCPSCDIAFVADGSQKWTPRTVGPADGIFLPSTEISE